MNIEHLQVCLETLMIKAQKQGADGADGIALTHQSVDVEARLGALEGATWSDSLRLGLRVIVGQRQGYVTSNDTSPEALDALVERALSMARAVPADPFCGLAPPAQLAPSPMMPPNGPWPPCSKWP